MSDSLEKVISIIIPVYQARDTLKKCVLSCLSQENIDLDEIEVILVDDGSTDGSEALCDELADSDERGRIKVIHTPNGGVSRARNTGIMQATGRFIAFVDSDDYVQSSMLGNMIKYADENTLLVDETDSYLGTQKISGFSYIENSVLNSNTHVWGKIYDRKTLLEGNVFFQEGLSIGEDLLFLMDYASFIGKKRSIRCVALEDYVYTENENSAMNSSFKKSYLDQISCWRQAEDKLLEIREYVSAYAFVSVAVSQIMTALLVAGKVATQTGEKDSDLDKKAVSMVKDQIKHALKVRGAFAGLSMGYKIKVLIFRINPDLYLRLYARHKGV